MPMLSYGAGTASTNLGFGSNAFLAVMQAAAYERFKEGRGFFITMEGLDDNGQQVSASHWISPAVPVRFTYDTRDDTGEPIRPFELEDQLVREMAEFMERPCGVIVGYTEESGINIPFVPLPNA